MEDVTDDVLGCPRCGEQIQDGDMKSTSLCGHTYHTSCFLEFIAGGGFYIRELRCNTCDAHIFPHEVMANHPESIADTQDHSAFHHWNNSPEFKAGLQAIKPFKRDMNKAAIAASAKSKLILAEMKAAIQEHVQAIKEKVREAKEKFKDSVEKKEHTKLMRGYNMRVNKFTKQWSTTIWSMRRALGNIPGAKSLIPEHNYHSRRCRVNGEYMFNIRIS